MQKIIKVDKKVIVLSEDGSYFEKDNVSDKLFNQLINAQSDEEVFRIIYPEYGNKAREYQSAIELKDNIKDSQLLVLKGESVYWEDVSQLSMPTELVKAVLDAEFSHDEDRKSVV